MQKVVGSNPIIRSRKKAPPKRGPFRCEVFGRALSWNLKFARAVVPSSNFTTSCRQVSSHALLVFQP